MSKRFSGKSSRGGGGGRRGGFITGDDGSLARQARRIQQRRAANARVGHVPNQFPHYSSKTGYCMCLGPCCLGPAGCCCRPCPCDKEIGHDHDSAGNATSYDGKTTASAERKAAKLRNR